MKDEVVITDHVEKLAKCLGAPVNRAKNDEWLSEYHNEGTSKARKSRLEELIVAGNYPMIISLIKKFAPSNTDKDKSRDMTQEGMIGMVKAIRSFNPDLGFTFSTHAFPNVSSSFRRVFADYDSLVRRPAHVIDKDALLTRLSYIYGGRLEVTWEVLQNHIRIESRTPLYAQSITKEYLEFWRDFSMARVYSVDDLSVGGSEDGSERSTDDKLELIGSRDSISTPSSDEVVGFERLKESAIGILSRRFNARDATIIKYRLELIPLPDEYLDKDPTLDTIGTVIGLTRERVRQIVGGGIKVLQSELSLD